MQIITARWHVSVENQFSLPRMARFSIFLFRTTVRDAVTANEERNIDSYPDG